MKIAIFIRVFAYAYPLLYGNKQKILFSCIKNEKFRTNSMVIMPFKYTDGKENSLYAWRAFSYGKKIEIFC